MGKNIPAELTREDTRVKTTKKLLTGKTVSFLVIVLSLSFFKIKNFIYPPKATSNNLCYAHQ
ncbi:TPA: hypothetical protein ACIJS5_004095, partial [Klebsiella aerogenes]